MPGRCREEIDVVRDAMPEMPRHAGAAGEVEAARRRDALPRRLHQHLVRAMIVTWISKDRL